MYFYLSLSAEPKQDLNIYIWATYNCVLPRTPQVTPKSEVYNPERDDELLFTCVMLLVVIQVSLR